MFKTKRVLSLVVLLFYVFSLLPCNVSLAVAAEEEDNEPQIDRIWPNVGSAHGGDTVRIYGKNLNVIKKIYFGVEEGTITARSNDQMVVKTPASPGGNAAIVDVRFVTKIGPNDEIEEQIIKEKWFEYKTSVGITAVTPIIGSIEGGVKVTISGYNFIKEGTSVEVYFGYLDLSDPQNPINGIQVDPQNIQVVDSQTITIITPSGSGVATVDIIVALKDANGEIIETAVFPGYQYVIPISEPRLIKIVNTDLNKPLAPTSGNINITAYVYDFRQGNAGESTDEGIYFGPDLKLKVNKVEDITNAERNLLIEEFPDLKTLINDGYKNGKLKKISGSLTVDPNLPLTEGFYDVTLINPDGAISQLFNYFEFRTTYMEIVGANPTQFDKADTGKENAKLTLLVANLTTDEISGNLEVYFVNEEGKTEKIVVVNRNEIKSSNGFHEISVNVPELTSGRKKVYLKSIFGFSKNDISIDIIGPELKPLIYAILGEEASGKINQEAPDNPLDENILGITKDLYAKGPVTGGTVITIYGKNFYNRLEDPLRVFIGDVEATDVVVDKYTFTGPGNEPITVDRITARTGPLTDDLPGLKDVRVINTGTRGSQDPKEIEKYTGVFRESFYYYSVPRITDVVPNNGRVTGDNIITVKGGQFYPGLKLSIQKNAAGQQEEVIISPENYIITDSREIIFRLPDLSQLFPEAEEKEPFEFQETVTIKIENIDGGTATWNQFKITNAPNDVTINSIDPDFGPYTGGTEVVIKGSGFKIPKGTVYFGWNKAEIKKWSQNEIIVVTPQVPRPGEVVVTIVNEDTSLATTTFYYTNPQTQPVIKSIFPTVGTEGTRVKIKGSDFWDGAQVRLGKNKIDPQLVEFVDSETIVVEIPKLTPGAYDVFVINPDSSVAKSNVKFTYEENVSKPTIESFDPTSGPTTGGIIVKIIGTDFRKGISVYFDDIPATVLRLEKEFNEDNEDLLYVRLPAFPEDRTEDEREVYITVINTDGGVGQSENTFKYIPVTPGSIPVIDEITPSQGSLAGGTRVVITGDKFRESVKIGEEMVKGVRVYFGHLEAEVVDVKYDSITVITPAWTGEIDQKGTAVVDVTVVNLGDYPGSATKPKAFTYVASNPKIHSVAPNIGSYKGGDFITILGEDFTDKVQVFLGDMEIQVVDIDVVNAGKIIFKTPSIENNLSKYLHVPLDVKVINKDGQTAVLPKAFTYKYPASSPKIIDVIPASGSTVGGQPIEIIGEDFREVIDPKTQQLLWPKVIIGGKEATDVVFISSERIKCRIPANPPGAAEVVVINEDGAMAVWKGFMYIASLSEPKITAVTPGQGPGAGGTLVTITGSDFRKGEDGSEPLVWFGNNLATDITWVAHNKITAVTPPGQGTVDVIVVNPDKGQAIYKGGFKYIDIPAPKLDSVTPNVGPASGGTPIEIKGDMFAKGAQVYIGGNLASDIEVVDKNTIRAVTPPGEPGWQEVRVVNPDGGWAKLDQGFLYRGKPDRPGWLQARAIDYQTIELTWEEVDFANNYEIYISTGSSGPYTFLDQVDGQDVLNKNNGEIRYYVTKLKPDTRYYFKVRAVNELGASQLTGYAWAITDDKAPKNYGKTPEADEVVISTTTDTVEVAVPSLEALKDTGYLLNLREQNKGIYRLNFSAAALTTSGRYLTVLGKGFTLSFDPWSILDPQYWGKSSRQLEGIYSNLTIADLGQQEAERALRSLPKGAKLLSRVYGIAWESQENKKKTAQDAFHSSFILSLEYSPAQVPAGKKVDIFTYNAQKGKWEATYAGSTYGSTLTLTLKKPGRFVIVAY